MYDKILRPDNSDSPSQSHDIYDFHDHHLALTSKLYAVVSCPLYSWLLDSFFHGAKAIATSAQNDRVQEKAVHLRFPLSPSTLLSPGKCLPSTSFMPEFCTQSMPT